MKNLKWEEESVFFIMYRRGSTDHWSNPVIPIPAVLFLTWEVSMKEFDEEMPRYCEFCECMLTDDEAVDNEGLCEACFDDAVVDQVATLRYPDNRRVL